MIKIGATWFFGGKKVKDPLKIQSVNSKRIFFYQAVDGGGRLCERLAQETANIARDVLISEEYNPVYIDEKYKKWKANKGYHTGIGRMTDTMLNSISAFRSGDRKGWVVGFKAGEFGAVGPATTNPVTKTPLEEYGYYFEAGNINQIRRPFMRYSLDKVMREKFDATVVNNFIKPFERTWWRPTWAFV